MSDYGKLYYVLTVIVTNGIKDNFRKSKILKCDRSKKWRLGKDEIEVFNSYKYLEVNQYLSLS